MGELLAVLALALFSANVFTVRLASTRLAQDVGFLVALGANVLFGVVLFGIDLLLRTRGFRVDPWGVGMFALAGICASYLGRRGFFASVQTLGPSRASAIQITNPVFAAVFAWALLGEHLGGWEIALMAVTLTGLLLSSLRRGDVSISSLHPSRTDRIGALWAAVPARLLLPALLSAAAYGAGNVLRAGALDMWPEPAFGGFVGALAGMVAYTAFHVFPRLASSRVREVTASGLALWTLAGVLTISAQVSVIAATAYIPVAVVLVISSALPIVVIPVSLLVLRRAEDVGRMTMLGSLLVLIGVAGILLLR